MTILINSKKYTLGKNLKEAKGLKDRLFGMLLKENQYGLLIKTHFGIHTFFMKFPIDVYILDKNLKVVKFKKNLKPNHLFFWNPKYSLVLELSTKT